MRTYENCVFLVDVRSTAAHALVRYSIASGVVVGTALPAGCEAVGLKLRQVQDAVSKGEGDALAFMAAGV